MSVARTSFYRPREQWGAVAPTPPPSNKLYKSFSPETFSINVQVHRSKLTSVDIEFMRVDFF